MRKTRFYVFGVLALALTFGLVLAACGGKKDSGGRNGDAGSSGGGQASVSESGGKQTLVETPASDFTYDLSGDGKGVVIKKYTGEGGALVIPAEIEGFPVVELADESFSGEDYGPGVYLTSVVIPSGVKKIGDEAFRKCENLVSVTFQGSGAALGFLTFGECTELTDLKFPDDEKALIPSLNDLTGTEWGNTAFEVCKKLPLAMRAKLKAMGFNEP
jgi:hypothetical protein